MDSSRPDPRPAPLAVAVRRLPHGQGLPLPEAATPGSSGLDLLAAVDAPVTLVPGERRVIPTGLVVAIPPGFEGQVRPRSGLALRHGISIPNAPGTIDSDYRGEVKVLLVNLGQEPWTLLRGQRVAQLVIAPVIVARLVEGGELPPTGRGEGGFGSTG